jgi:molybdopterin converting factor small subunit
MKAEGTRSRWRSSGATGEAFATLRLHGSLGKLPGGRRLEVEKISVPVTVGELLSGLSDSLSLDLRRDSTLVLVNGVEANALQDLETVICEGDEVSLVPMLHGGAGT